MNQDIQKNRREKKSFKICKRIAKCKKRSFEKEVFRYRGNVFKTKGEQEKIKTDMNKISKYIAEEEININEKLFNKYFKIQKPSDMLIYLNKTNDKEKNIESVNMINNGLKDLEEEIKKMSEEEKKIEDPELIVEIVEKILKFNKQNQEGQGLKILTPNQMLNRLPISLAQLKAGNNSKKT